MVKEHQSDLELGLLVLPPLQLEHSLEVLYLHLDEGLSMHHHRVRGGGVWIATAPYRGGAG